MPLVKETIDPMAPIKTGDVVYMTSATIIRGFMRMSFNAGPKARMVFLLLGNEPRDGSAPLDIEARLRVLGLMPVPEEELAGGSTT